MHVLVRSQTRIHELTKMVLEGEDIGPDDARYILQFPEDQLEMLLECASLIRERFRGRRADLCAIVNAKSGLCSEDCKFCSQSTRWNTNVSRYPLISAEDAIRKAEEAYRMGATKFGIVISGRGPTQKELESVIQMVKEIRERVPGIYVDVCLGELSWDQAVKLRDAGVRYANHNIETSRSYFRKVCTTHTYDDRLRTIRILKEVGIKLCCGCLFGMGESDEDRIWVAFELRRIDPDIIPVNFLNPRPGTPFGDVPLMSPSEAAKCIAMMRFVNPTKLIRVAGGREVVFGDKQRWVFEAGADGIIVGNYLTTPGQEHTMDWELILSAGLELPEHIRFRSREDAV